LLVTYYSDISWLARLWSPKLLKKSISSFLKLSAVKCFFCFLFCNKVFIKLFYLLANLIIDFSILANFSLYLIYALSRTDYVRECFESECLSLPYFFNDEDAIGATKDMEVLFLSMLVIASKELDKMLGRSFLYLEDSGLGR